MPDGRPWPSVSVVTPSYNQGHFIEETIRSVLLQGYPSLQYIVMDGASRDQTINILHRYQPFIDICVSEKDAGQADAINRGFRRATGQWKGWQNSDDFYEPGALAALASAAAQHPNDSVLYGTVKLCDAQSKLTGAYPTGEFDLHNMFPWANMFNQSMFFHRRVFDAGHFIDESFKHYVDHDFFWRLILAGYTFRHVPSISAVFRLHDQAKGVTQQEIAAAELHALYKRLYQEQSLPQSVRRRALASMRAHCIDQFGKSRWRLFDKFTADLRHLAGIRAMGFNLSLRRLATRLGVGNIDRVRRLKRLVSKRGVA